jgi:hypothetical protein
MWYLRTIVSPMIKMQKWSQMLAGDLHTRDGSWHHSGASPRLTSELGHYFGMDENQLKDV